MSNQINDILKDNAIRDIEMEGSNMDEFSVLFPEYREWDIVTLLKKAQDYVNYLRHIQGQDKMEPDYNKVK